jgi:uncharacterized repeat protein (TIGR03803 family)
MAIPRRSSLLLLSTFLLSVAMTISATAQTLTTLVNFNGSNGGEPNGPLIQAIDGSFYGTTSSGVGFDGTVFKMTPSGTVTTLYEFCSQPNCADGAFPAAGLVQAPDGNFYGTTSQGGTSSNCSLQLGCGTVFKITPGGALTTLYNFCSSANCADGRVPLGTLLQGSDGSFYGTTPNGGVNRGAAGYGTVFKITPNGSLTTIYRFCSRQGCTDGAFPNPTLVQGTDGNLYGTTNNTGIGDGHGTVFRLTLAGVLTTIYNFCSQLNCADGYAPLAGPVQAVDGNLYGTTFLGGGNNGCNGNGCGTAFKINPSGALTVLHAFNSPTDGVIVQASLVQATDANLYGATVAGGAQNYGTIFRVSPSGDFTTLYNFCSQPNCADGGQSAGGMIQGTDGNFYGTTTSFGVYGGGTVFRLSTGLTPFVETQPTIGQAGTLVTILGSNLTGATSVTFNGTPATFNVVSSSEITTNVPSGATTGTVQVTTPGGMLKSVAGFQVIGPLQLVPVTPCRLVDTRNSGGPISGGTSRSFTVPQLGSCGIPASAAAYSLNVTVVPSGPLGYLTIWPEGEIQPYTSTMNSSDGRIKANAAIVPAGNNAVSVYVSNTTNVILDINGYFAAADSQTYQFYTLAPCRLVDTRNNQDGGSLQAGVERDYLIPPNCDVPTSAVAYSFNVTVVPSYGALDYLTVWPQGETQPLVSTLNDYTGTVVANAAVVPAGSNNTTAFYAHNNKTDLLVDIDGYFAAPGSGGFSFYPAAPCRAYDSRNNNGQPFTGERTVNIVDSPCAPPSNATAYVFNATVVPHGSLGYLSLWPDSEPQPVVSTLNAQDGFAASNMAIVPNVNGSTDAYAGNGDTQLILDISGYFAP